MEVSIKMKEKTCTFKSVLVGGCFVSKDVPYMKIQNGFNFSCAVNFNTGKVERFDDEEVVTPMGCRCEMFEEGEG